MYPHVPTDCETLRDMRKQMRRHWAAVRQGERKGVDGVFFLKAQECREKSIKLAAQMVDHASTCNQCAKDAALEQVHFYGVYPLSGI